MIAVLADELIELGKGQVLASITPLNHVNSHGGEIAEHLYVGWRDGDSSLRAEHLRNGDVEA